MYPLYSLYRNYPEVFWGRVALTLCLLCGGILLIVLAYKKGRITRYKRNIAVIWWTYFLFLLYITIIGRYSAEYYRTRFAPFESYRFIYGEGSFEELGAIILNILIFIPFGVITAELIKDRFPAWYALAAGVIMTVKIEVVQLVARTGTFETDDIMHNTLGTALGILLWYGIRALMKKRRKE